MGGNKPPGVSGPCLAQIQDAVGWSNYTVIAAGCKASASGKDVLESAAVNADLKYAPVEISLGVIKSLES